MIDHVMIYIADYSASRAFYDNSLALLGIKRLMTFDENNTAGYGDTIKPYFWISDKVNRGPEEEIGKGMHVAFSAPNQQAVDRWYETCLKFGGQDNGKPGLRSEYHPHYYAAFIIDPDGWRIEAVCHN
ncbi:MAG: VOC family protein [Candidatus Babeliales bacterium]